MIIHPFKDKPHTHEVARRLTDIFNRFGGRNHGKTLMVLRAMTVYLLNEPAPTPVIRCSTPAKRELMWEVMNEWYSTESTGFTVDQPTTVRPSQLGLTRNLDDRRIVINLTVV